MKSSTRIPTCQEVNIPGRPPIRLTRLVLPSLAATIARSLPQLEALNAAGKSQDDASAALGIAVGTLRGWCDLTGIRWSALKQYKKRVSK